MEHTKHDEHVLNQATLFATRHPHCGACIFYTPEDDIHGQCHYHDDGYQLGKPGTPAKAHHTCPCFIPERIRTLISMFANHATTRPLTDDGKESIDVALEKVLEKDHRVGLNDFCRATSATLGHSQGLIKNYVKMKIDRGELVLYKQNVGMPALQNMVCKPEFVPDEAEQEAICKAIRAEWRSNRKAKAKKPAKKSVKSKASAKQ